MSKRAFTPGRAIGLESRIALSGLPGSPPRHFALSSAGYDTNLATIQGDFGQYKFSGNFKLLQTQLASQETQVPFGRVDGLGPQTTAILNQMRSDQAGHHPGAISRANQRLDALIRAIVAAHVADGSLTIYHR